MEAKLDQTRPRRTILTVDHFKEIRWFEEWLYRLEYSIVPGIPRHSGYKEVPKTITFYDLCIKTNIRLRIWPEDTPEDCRFTPRLCPLIKAPVKKWCRAYNSPLDFVYDYNLKDYNFRKFKTDDDLVQKIRTGKGDEMHKTW